jgi:hypothetical protein
MPLVLPTPVLRAEKRRKLNVLARPRDLPVPMAYGGEIDVNAAAYGELDNALGMGQQPYGSPVIHGAPSWVWHLPDSDPRKMEALDAWSGEMYGDDWKKWEQYSPYSNVREVPGFQYGGWLDAGEDPSAIRAAEYAALNTAAAPTMPPVGDWYAQQAASMGTDPEAERYRFLTTQTTGPLGQDALDFINWYETRQQIGDFARNVGQRTVGLAERGAQIADMGARSEEQATALAQAPTGIDAGFTPEQMDTMLASLAQSDLGVARGDPALANIPQFWMGKTRPGGPAFGPLGDLVDTSEDRFGLASRLLPGDPLGLIEAFGGPSRGDVYRGAYQPATEPFNRAITAARGPLLDAIDIGSEFFGPTRMLNLAGDALPILPDTRQAADIALPRNIEELAVEFVPGIGFVPGGVSALRSGARAAPRLGASQLSDPVAGNIVKNVSRTATSQGDIVRTRFVADDGSAVEWTLRPDGEAYFQDVRAMQPGQGVGSRLRDIALDDMRQVAGPGARVSADFVSEGGERLFRNQPGITYTDALGRPISAEDAQRLAAEGQTPRGYFTLGARDDSNLDDFIATITQDPVEARRLKDRLARISTPERLTERADEALTNWQDPNIMDRIVGGIRHGEEGAFRLGRQDEASVQRAAAEAVQKGLTKRQQAMVNASAEEIEAYFRANPEFAGATLNDLGVGGAKGEPTLIRAKILRWRESVLDALRGGEEGAFRLSRDLAGAKPRYRDAELVFDSDLDKAAYITAQTKRSKRDADFLGQVMSETGLDEAAVREYGARVRASIKGLEAEDGVITVPSVEDFARPTKAPTLATGRAAGLNAVMGEPAPDVVVGQIRQVTQPRGGQTLGQVSAIRGNTVEFVHATKGTPLPSVPLDAVRRAPTLRMGDDVVVDALPGARGAPPSTPPETPPLPVPARVQKAAEAAATPSPTSAVPSVADVKEINALHRHTVRQRGPNASTDAAIKNYVHRLRRLTAKFDPEHLSVFNEVDQAIAHNAPAGMWADIEFSLSRLHERIAKNLGQVARSGEDIALPGRAVTEIAPPPSAAAPPPSAGAPPPVEPPTPPPLSPTPNGGDLVPPPDAVGHRFLAPLRDFDDTVGEVVTSDNPAVRAIVGRTGINPSVLENTPVGRALVGHVRQRQAANHLVDVGVTAALDAHRVRGTGILTEGLRSKTRVLPISDDGLMTVRTVANPTVSGKTPWQDVFSAPDAYVLSKKARAYIDDYLAVVNEAEQLRVDAGLRPRAKTKDGWFYIPRQVKERRGIAARRPSDPGLRRIYDEAVEGYSKGVRYDSDPRATLDLHTQQAYRDIAEKQLSDYLEPYSITPSELIPKPIRDRYREAVLTKLDAERNVRALRIKAKLRPKSTQARNLYEESQLVRESARKEHTAARSAYMARKASALKETQAPASLFQGGADGEIPIREWRNRFFKLEDGDKLNKALPQIMPTGDRNLFNTAMEVVEKTANLTRFMSAVGDFATPFIQGAPTLARNPAAWTRATALHYGAFFDPTVQARYIRNHLERFQEMSQHGVPVGDIEFFRAAQEGGGFEFGRAIEEVGDRLKAGAGTKGRGVLRAVVGKQSVGRFQSSYNTFFTVTRSELWDGIRLAPAERARVIRNMTGGLDSAILGVGKTQRAAESVWLAFSPKLLRSTTALIAEAPKLHTAAGRESFRTLGTLVGAGTAMYVAAGLALGRDWDEIEGGLNPLEGKRFLSYEINGDWIGIGGQVRAITQIMTKLGATFYEAGAAGSAEPLGKLVAGDFYDNPLLNFYYARGAPALNITAGGVEALTGLDVLPYENLSGLPDLSYHIGSSSIPFAVQGIVEGENAITAIAALLGARTSAETLSEKRGSQQAEAFDLAVQAGAVPAELVSALRDVDYADMTSREKRLLRDAYEKIDPGLLEDIEERARESGSIFQKARDREATYWETSETRLAELAASLRTASNPPKTTAATIEALIEEANLPYKEKAYADAVAGLPANDIYKLMDVWYGLIDKPAYQKDGVPDYDKIDAAREKLLAGVRRMDRALADRLEYNVSRQANPDDPPLIQLYTTWQAARSGYYGSSADAKTTQEVDRMREAYRRANPQTDFLLWYFGDVTTIKSHEAFLLADKAARGREIKVDYVAAR